ncbi:MAG: holo-ACP synthase [Armatimonadota bacterium]
MNISPPELPANLGIRGVGIDIEDVDRIRKAVESHGSRFLNRILTQTEQDACLGRDDWPQRIAARWCAKEAVAKALGGGMGWTDVEILNHPSGQPYVQLSGRAATLAGTGAVHISLTHTATQAAAIAIFVDAR